MNHGFIRVAVATPSIRVADPAYNAAQVLELTRQLPADTALAAFPELCLTGYTCGDLFLQPTLLQGAEAALKRLLRETVGVDTVLAVGLPVPVGAALYNCAAVCHRGVLLGLVPKTHLPTYGEFYEARHFAPAPPETRTVVFAGQQTALGAAQLFRCAEMPDFCFGVELCEALWVPQPPSTRLATAGATVIVNLSASDEATGKVAYRRELLRSHSARLLCAYLYADAGEGESSTDLVFAGHGLIAENGALLAERARYTTGVTATEIDVQRLVYDRRRMGTFPPTGEALPTVAFSLPVRELSLTRAVPPLPFSETSAGVHAGPFDWLMSPFTVMPIQIFNWTSRPDPAFEVNAAAAGFVLMAMALAMNGLAIWLRYRMRKNIKW